MTVSYDAQRKTKKLNKFFGNNDDKEKE